MTLARAYATDRQRQSALRWLRRAEDLAAADHTDGSPSWAALNGSVLARVTNQSAKVWAVLGDHATAETLHSRAAARWNPDTHQRIRALTLSSAASAQAAQGHIEQACATWSQAVSGLRATRSARAQQAISSIRATLSTPRHRTLPAARSLLAAISTG
jgi:tetratricopeptide (TPR) repeat protein